MSETHLARIKVLMDLGNQCIEEVQEAEEAGMDPKAALEIMVIYAGDLGKMAGMVISQVLAQVDGDLEEEMLEALMADIRTGMEMERSRH